MKLTSVTKSLPLYPFSSFVASSLIVSSAQWSVGKDSLDLVIPKVHIFWYVTQVKHIGSPLEFRSITLLHDKLGCGDRRESGHSVVVPGCQLHSHA